MISVSGTQTVVGLFPGQGGYRKGAMAKAWEAGDPVVHEVFDRIDEVSRSRQGHAVSSLVFRSDPPTLAQMAADAHDSLQLAIFGASIVAYRRLSGAQPPILLGHSLGEISALVCGGAWSLADGASIICDRNEVLREHAPKGQGMLALACGADQGEHIVQLISAGDLVLGVDGSSRQCVLSGPDRLLDVAARIADALGIRATRVPTAYGFHNPRLAGAGWQFSGKVASYTQNPLDSRVFSPILGRYYQDSDDLAGILGAHLTHPVQFRQTIEALWRDGVRNFVELGDGGVLASLVKATFPFASTTPAHEHGQVVSGIAALPDPPLPRPRHHESIVHRDAEQAPPPVAMPETSPTVVDRDEILVKIQQLFADALEYPVEVLTEDAELEAELGVDSIRKTDLLATVRKLFGIAAPPSDYQTSDYDTLSRIVDFVVEQLGLHPAGV